MVMTPSWREMQHLLNAEVQSSSSNTSLAGIKFKNIFKLNKVLALKLEAWKGMGIKMSESSRFSREKENIVKPFNTILSQIWYNPDSTLDLEGEKNFFFSLVMDRWVCSWFTNLKETLCFIWFSFLWCYGISVIFVISYKCTDMAYVVFTCTTPVFLLDTEKQKNAWTSSWYP